MNGETNANRLPLILSIAALACALIALYFALMRDPLGKGMGAYDFSTPEAALRSSLQIQQARDLRAQLQLDRLERGKQLDERIRTLKVDHAADYQGKKVLFVTYERDGKATYSIEWFEKQPDGDIWLSSYVSPYDIHDNPQLVQEIEQWQSKGMEGSMMKDSPSSPASNESP